MVFLYLLEQTIRENHVSSRERQLEKPASGAVAAKGKKEGQKEKKQWRLRTVGDERSMLSRRKCGMKHDQRDEARTQRKRYGFTTVQLSTTEFLGKDPDRRKAFKKGIQPICFAFQRG